MDEVIWALWCIFKYMKYNCLLLLWIFTLLFRYFNLSEIETSTPYWNIWLLYGSNCKYPKSAAELGPYLEDNGAGGLRCADVGMFMSDHFTGYNDLWLGGMGGDPPHWEGNGGGCITVYHNVLKGRNDGDKPMGSSIPPRWRRPRERWAWRMWRPISTGAIIKFCNTLWIATFLNCDWRQNILRNNMWWGDGGIREPYIPWDCGSRGGWGVWRGQRSWTTVRPLEESVGIR